VTRGDDDERDEGSQEAVDKSRRSYRFLVEVWAEAREHPSLPARVRARVRDLDGSSDRYVGSFAEMERIIDQRLDEAGVSPRRWERDSG